MALSQRGASPDIEALEAEGLQWTRHFDNITSQYARQKGAGLAAFECERDKLQDEIKSLKQMLDQLEREYEAAVKEQQQAYLARLERHIKGRSDFMLPQVGDHQSGREMRVNTPPPSATSRESPKTSSNQGRQTDCARAEPDPEQPSQDKGLTKPLAEGVAPERRTHQIIEEARNYETREKGKKGPNAPKRCLSAYMFFANEQRQNVRDENPGISLGQLGKILGERWKALNDKQRAPYEAKAAADGKRYEDENRAYNGGDDESS